jgi:hypothetical protein
MSSVSTLNYAYLGKYLMPHTVPYSGGSVHGWVGAAAVAHVLLGRAGQEQLVLLVGLVAAAPRQLAHRDGMVAAPPGTSAAKLIEAAVM